MYRLICNKYRFMSRRQSRRKMPEETKIVANVEEKEVETSYRQATECWNICKIYIIWILVHVVSSNLYCYYCAHLSVYGLFMSPFVAVAPHCKALGWLMTSSIAYINSMWLTLGTWLITKIPSCVG